MSLPDRYWEPRNLFDAARLHYTVKIRCKRCGDEKVYDPHALWYLFARKGWDNRTREIGRRMFCSRCWSKLRTKVRHPQITFGRDEPTGDQPPMPDALDWKRELKRHRS